MFNNIPKNWEIKQLGDITEVVAGGTPSTQKAEYWDGDIPWITPKDLSNYTFKYIAKGERCITEEGLKGSSAKLMPKDTVLFTSRAPIGYVAIAQNEISTNQGFKNFICGEKILPDYLYYYLKNNKAYVESLAAGATFKEISATTTKKIKIPLPPTIEEQKEIIKILHTANDMVRLRQECIDHTNNLIPAIFQEMFGNPLVKDIRYKKEKLTQFFDFKSGGTPSRQCSEFFDGTIPWITTIALKKMLINQDDAVEKITEDAISRSSTKIIPKNSLLLGTRVGVGKVAINTVDICTNQDIVALISVINSQLNLIYTYWYFVAIKPFLESQSRGATIQGITINLVKNLEIPLPPRELQEDFARKAQAIEDYKK